MSAEEALPLFVAGLSSSPHAQSLSLGAVALAAGSRRTCSLVCAWEVLGGRLSDSIFIFSLLNKTGCVQP